MRLFPPEFRGLLLNAESKVLGVEKVRFGGLIWPIKKNQHMHILKAVLHFGRPDLTVKAM